MQWMSELGRRVRMSFGRGQFDRDLQDEMRLHQELRAREIASRGASADDARAAARRRFGNPTLLREQSRDAWGWRWLDQLLQDVRYGARLLRRSPGFAVVAILTLALGIGANTAIFSIVYGVLVRPLPYPGADRVAVAFLRFSPQNMERGPLSAADFLDFKNRSHTFEQIGAYANLRYDLTGDGVAEQLTGAAVTPEFFSILQVTPEAGRLFKPSEGVPAAGRVAVISDALWRRRFHGDADVLGKPLRLSGKTYTVVGIMPPQFRIPNAEAEVWTNLSLEPPKRRGPFYLTGIARLRPGITWNQVQADADYVAQSIERENPKQYSHLSMLPMPLRDALVGNARLPLMILLAAVGCVLLISAVNVANLLLARATGRQREIAMRLCLGASRRRVLLQLTTESVLLALLGGCLGVLLAVAAVRGLRGWHAPAYVPRLDDVRLDWPVLVFATGISFLTGIAFGILPGLGRWKLSLSSTLKQGGRGTTDGRDGKLRGALVVCEVGLCVVLLAGGGLFLRSLLRLESVDLGTTAPIDHVLLVPISTPPAAAAGDQKDLAGVRLYADLLDRVRRLPGVRSAGLTDARVPNYWANSDTFQVEGIPWNEQAFPSTPLPDVSAGYFEALGIPVLRGRTFDEHDTPDSQIVARVSAEFVRRYFANTDPIGHYLRESGPGTPNSRRVQIVGVVADVPYDGLSRAPEPVFYEPLTQSMWRRVFLVVRSDADPHSLAAPITRELQSADANLVVGRIATLQETLSEAVNEPRFLTQLVGAFAILSLVLATIGLYGVISYLAGQRTHEIGVRMALGAQPRQVLMMVISRGVTLAVAGTICGAIVALFTTRMFTRLLFGVKPADPVTFLAVAGILIVVALAASYIPARRATRIDPMVALRYD